MAHRLDKNELRGALEAWAYVSGFGGALEDAVGRGLGWLRQLWAQGLDHLPLDLVMDLGHLLIEGRAFAFASDVRLAAWPSDEVGWRLAYEDKTLGRWAIDPSVVEAQQILARRPAAQMEPAVVHALGLAFGSALPSADAFQGNPAFIKTLSGESPLFVASVAAVVSDEAPSVDAGWVAWARRQREAVCAALRPHLLTPQDLWELTHIDHLPSASTRLALRQLREIADNITPLAPGWGAELLRRSREIATEETTDDDFPAGGFEALSRRGRFENLVRSEMGYIGEASGGGPDLFDVRYAQGELMYYTRDDSPLYNTRVAWSAVF